MPRIIILFLFCFVVADAFTNIPANRVSDDYITPFVLLGLRTVPFALEAHGDLAVTLDSNEEIVSLKRNQSGYYHRVDSKPYGIIIDPYSSGLAITVSTNGRWAARATVLGHEIFELNDDATFNRNYTLKFINGYYGWIFEDGSYVAFAADAIYTCEFNGTGWSITHKDIPDNYTVLAQFISKNVGPPIMRKHLNYVSVVYQGMSGQIFYRNANKSWSVFDNVILFDSSIQSPDYVHLLWDGNNTLIVSTFGKAASRPIGTIVIYKRGMAGWEQKQVIAPASLGITGNGYFGDELVQLDSNNYVVTAPFDGATNNVPGTVVGSVWWLHRDETDTWSITRRVTSAVRDGFFGMAAAPVDNSFITVECYMASPSPGDTACYIHSIELCYEDPTDVTCHDQHLSSCSSFDIDVNSLYTINTPAKCGEVSVQTNNVVRSDAQGFSLDLTFTRSGSSDVTCTVNALCNNTVPTTSVPISAPQSPTKDTSGATFLRHSANMILLLALLMITL